jgi:hypothetical protein
MVGSLLLAQRPIHYVTIAQYGIADEDIYNFDKTGFAMGVIATAKVVTILENLGNQVLLQPGNRGWVTVIEAVNSTGLAIPPVIIFKGKVHIQSWLRIFHAIGQYQLVLMAGLRMNLASNGLKTPSILTPRAEKGGDIEYLFSTAMAAILHPNLTIIARKTILFQCMPPHSSHLLQPLDVGCFAVLGSLCRRNDARRYSSY